MADSNTSILELPVELVKDLLNECSVPDLYNCLTSGELAEQHILYTLQAYPFTVTIRDEDLPLRVTEHNNFFQRYGNEIRKVKYEIQWEPLDLNRFKQVFEWLNYNCANITSITIDCRVENKLVHAFFEILEIVKKKPTITTLCLKCPVFHWPDNYRELKYLVNLCRLENRSIRFFINANIDELYKMFFRKINREQNFCHIIYR